MSYSIQFYRVKNDVNGNPRYVCHHLSLLHIQGFESTGDHYEIALSNAKKISGKRFHNKQFGGGIVFTSYNLDSLVSAIAEITGINYSCYTLKRV